LDVPKADVAWHKAPDDVVGPVDELRHREMPEQAECRVHVPKELAVGAVESLPVVEQYIAESAEAKARLRTSCGIHEPLRAGSQGLKDFGIASRAGELRCFECREHGWQVRGVLDMHDDVSTSNREGGGSLRSHRAQESAGRSNGEGRNLSQNGYGATSLFLFVIL
jgi:hypothetical protein